MMIMNLFRFVMLRDYHFKFVEHMSSLDSGSYNWFDSFQNVVCLTTLLFPYSLELLIGKNLSIEVQKCVQHASPAH